MASPRKAEAGTGELVTVSSRVQPQEKSSMQIAGMLLLHTNDLFSKFKKHEYGCRQRHTLSNYIRDPLAVLLETLGMIDGLPCPLTSCIHILCTEWYYNLRDSRPRIETR
jgi:hypothetical protein